jgi:hypothetical protein
MPIVSKKTWTTGGHHVLLSRSKFLTGGHDSHWISHRMSTNVDPGLKDKTCWLIVGSITKKLQIITANHHNESSWWIIMMNHHHPPHHHPHPHHHHHPHHPHRILFNSVPPLTNTWLSYSAVDVLPSSKTTSKGPSFSASAQAAHARADNIWLWKWGNDTSKRPLNMVITHDSLKHLSCYWN